MTKKEFDQINTAISRLIGRFAAKGVCPCCLARGLMHRGAALMEDVADADAVAATCADIVDQLDGDDAMPANDTQH